ncbi:MAG: hypothetical protein A07HR60_02593 [uncultured archaeon A07HR60]|nr:MAG: hypothetical protein A07HR60_02593 [uncultured archaeon A07HR60]
MEISTSVDICFGDAETLVSSPFSQFYFLHALTDVESHRGISACRGLYPD